MTTNRFTTWVLAGVDGSERALDAVRWAAREARRRGVGLRLVTVSPWTEGRDFEFGGAPATAPEQHRATLNDLDHAMAVAHDAADTVEIDRAILAGFPPARLRLESGRVALVVLGDRGLGGVKGMWVGSVAGSVVAGAHCPVVVARGPGPSELLDFAEVVVGVDDSPAAEAAIEFAFGAADTREASLTAVHSWHDRLLDSAPFPMLNVHSARAEARELLSQRLEGWPEKYPSVPVRQVVTNDPPAQVLLERSAKARLLVVGTHGRGRVVGDLLGSVSQTVIHRANCPVAVIPAPHS
jgi:nucleotide-binding universal stress UspA family protein